MCDAFRFPSPGAPALIEFDNAGVPILPVERQDRRNEQLLWGRRTGEKGALPLGACVGHKLLEAGTWDGYRPQPVRIRPVSFRTAGVKSGWHDLVGSYWILGVLASQGDEERVYVVTVSTPEASAESTWPWIEWTTFLPAFLNLPIPKGRGF